MRDAVICEPLRTPVGGFGGSLRDVPVHALAATVTLVVRDHGPGRADILTDQIHTFEACNPTCTDLQTSVHAPN